MILLIVPPTLHAPVLRLDVALALLVLLFVQVLVLIDAPPRSPPSTTHPQSQRTNDGERTRNKEEKGIRKKQRAAHICVDRAVAINVKQSRCHIMCTIEPLHMLYEIEPLAHVYNCNRAVDILVGKKHWF